jgi:hypothetical protein
MAKIHADRESIFVFLLTNVFVDEKIFWLVKIDLLLRPLTYQCRDVNTIFFCGSRKYASQHFALSANCNPCHLPQHSAKCRWRMIAFLGTGLLGSSFVRASLKRGEKVNVWNRTIEKTAALSREGAQRALLQVRSSAQPSAVLGHLASPTINPKFYRAISASAGVARSGDRKSDHSWPWALCSSIGHLP